MKLAIECTWACNTCEIIELPVGYLWDNVESWYVKWGRLHLSFCNGETLEFEIVSDGDLVDWKRPDSTSIYRVESDGNINFENPLVENC